MDGTLIDQTAAIIRCYADVITELGHPTPDSNVIRRSLGGPMASTMELFIPSEQMDEACRAFRKRFPEIMFEGLIILPGALELIAAFAEHQVPQAILTNKHGDTARLVSAHCGFNKHIEICIGNTDTEWSKPDSKLTKHVLSQINSSSEGAICIGDSPTDVATATNAGLDCYCVNTGAHSSEELQAAGAMLTVSDLLELKTQFTL